MNLFVPCPHSSWLSFCIHTDSKYLTMVCLCMELCFRTEYLSITSSETYTAFIHPNHPSTWQIVKKLLLCCWEVVGAKVKRTIQIYKGVGWFWTGIPSSDVTHTWDKCQKPHSGGGMVVVYGILRTLLLIWCVSSRKIEINRFLLGEA